MKKWTGPGSFMDLGPVRESGGPVKKTGLVLPDPNQLFFTIYTKVSVFLYLLQPITNDNLKQYYFLKSNFEFYILVSLNFLVNTVSSLTNLLADTVSAWHL